MYNILLNADQTTTDTRFAAYIAKCEAENDAIGQRYEAEQAPTTGVEAQP